MPALPDLSPDCPRCAALCCILLPFDMGPAFAEDKPAGQPCRHLGQDLRCTIHDSLARRGYSGCAAYSCLGAGQRATALLAREGAGQAETVFRQLRQVHEALSLLLTAARLPLPPEVETQRQALIDRLDAGRDWALADLQAACDREGILPEIRAWLGGLQGLVTPPRR